MNRGDRAAALQDLYREIFDHYAPRDPHLVERPLIEGALESRILLLGQALAEKTQRLSGIPYCLPPPQNPRLSDGGRQLDRFLALFEYTIDPTRTSERQYAHHTDLVHYFPGKRGRGIGDVPPSPTDIAHDWEWFEREVTILEPTIVVALGKSAAKEFSSRYLSRRVRRLRDLPVRPVPTTVGPTELSFLAVHHPSGAYQHPTSSKRYEEAARHIRHILQS